MQRLLSEKEAAQIDARLHDNALLQACHQVWPRLQEEIVSVMARPEDIFCEAATLMDELIDVDDSIDTTSLIQGLWSNVVMEVGSWNNNGVSLSERFLIVSSVFRIVATSFSLHWNSRYCDTMRDALLMVIDEKRPESADLHQFKQQERQQQVLFTAIIPCTEILNDWVNDYIDNPDYWLTDELELALTPPTTVIKSKKIETITGKKKFNADTFRETFIYSPQDMISEERIMRLKMAFISMRGVLISLDTHYDTFESLFSGNPLDVKIVWIGTNSQLRKLFSLLVTKNKLVKKPTGGLNQILMAKFKHADGTNFTAAEIRNAGNDGNMQAVEDVVDCLTPKPATIEDLELQLARMRTEELDTFNGKHNGRYITSKPIGTNVSNTPNQHTRVTKKKQ